MRNLMKKIYKKIYKKKYKRILNKISIFLDNQYIYISYMMFNFCNRFIYIYQKIFNNLITNNRTNHNNYFRKKY